MTEEVINPGHDVIGSDGEKLGTVAYVVVHPKEMHITDLVVSTGAVIGRDIVVPMTDVDRVADDKVYLTIDKDRLGSYKDYVDVEYQGPPADWAPTSGMIYPSGSILWPAGTYYPESSKVTVNAPTGTVGLHHGMDVVCADGHKVGSVDALVADPKTEDLTEIVIKHGHIFTHDTAIPINLVQSVESDQVKLSLSRDEVEQRFGKSS